MASCVHSVEGSPIWRHRGYIVHVHVDHGQQFVHCLGVRGPQGFDIVLLLTALLVALHQFLLHLDRLTNINECARPAGDDTETSSLSEGVSLEVVHAHRNEVEIRIGMIAHESQTHDGNTHLERQEVE